MFGLARAAFAWGPGGVVQGRVAVQGLPAVNWRLAVQVGGWWWCEGGGGGVREVVV